MLILSSIIKNAIPFQTVVLDYIQAGMKTPFKTDKPLWLPISGMFGVSLSAVELFSYIYIFLYLHQHNRTLHILPEETKKSRNKFNAQTMLGQIYLYITDLIYFLFLMVAFAFGTSYVAAETKDLIGLVKITEFGVLSAIHCLLIPQLRNTVFDKVQMEFELFKVFDKSRLPFKRLHTHLKTKVAPMEVRLNKLK